MIVDLHCGSVDPAEWGAKAATLMCLTQAGLPVAPGLCISESSGTAALAVAVDTWLHATWAEKVIVRSSTSSEDRSDGAGAGRSLSVPDLEPNLDAVLSAVETVRLHAHQHDLDLRSTILQEQHEATLSGVAFYYREIGRLEVEAHPAAAGITSGEPPAVSARIADDQIVTSTVRELPFPIGRLLLTLCRECARALDADVDVEWGSSAGGVVVHQARPVTASADHG